MTQTNTNANLAAAEESTTDKTAPASCPLNAPYLQLIPVRYAYVENLAYKKADASKKQIHPTGVRLLRDGWLYVVDTHINRIYEHTLKDGLITARTFKGKLVTDQTRESYDDIVQDKGDEKRLLFKKGHKVYVSYSQVQWSDEKCNQMLKSKERKTFMQEIDLANVSCENITSHLMTREQAEILRTPKRSRS